MHDNIGAHCKGSYPHVDIDPPNVCGVGNNRVHEGQECDSVARQFGGKQRNFSGENLWARGYAVSTVGFELDAIKKYIAEQEKTHSDREEGKF